MLTQNGLLVLIDFGTVREITDTYESKHAAKQITTIHTPGYAALEQFNGQASPQSDFFALGRTFVYLLTGIPTVKFCAILKKQGACVAYA
jgi:serine/threonine protein kinase